MTTASIGDLVGWRVKAIQEGKRFARTPRRHSYDEHDPRAQIFRPICGGRTADALRWRDDARAASKCVGAFRAM